MEKVRIDSARGQAEVMGALVCIGGALTFTFWKGGFLLAGFMKRPLIDVHVLNPGGKHWVKGSALILISHVAWSSWLILQVKSTSTKIIIMPV